MHRFKNQFQIGLLMSAFILLSGCDRPRVFDPESRNQSYAYFSKIRTDRDNFVVCTKQIGQKGKSTAFSIAKKECAKFGKRAKYKNYSIATCPLSTASSWHFSCQKV